MPVRPEMRRHYANPAWRALSLRIRKERAQDRCECVGECGTDHREELCELNAAEGVGLDWLIDTHRCSAFEGEAHPVTGSVVRLTVGHRNHDPTQNQEENLAAWCQRCHNRHDTAHRKANAHLTRRAKKATGDLLESNR